MKTRKTLLLSPDEVDFALTIMYPMSGWFGDKLFVVYEDAEGDVDFKIMTPEAIAKNFSVDLEKIKVFIDTCNQ